MIFGYARVSTRKQAEGNSLEAQEQSLRAAGAEIIYTDVYTGADTDRPRFQKLLEDIKSDDTLIVTKLDRFARSIGNANEIITELLKRNVKIHVLNMGIIDNSPASKLMRCMFLAFAEFERDLIIERTQEGKAIARKNPDFKDGRPPRYTDEEIEYALELLNSYTCKKVTEMTGISKSTLYRALNKKKN